MRRLAEIKHIIRTQFKISTIAIKKLSLLACFLIFVLARIIKLEIQKVRITRGIFRVSIRRRWFTMMGAHRGGVRTTSDSIAIHRSKIINKVQ